MSETHAAPTLPALADPAQLAGHALVLHLLGRLLHEAPAADRLQALADEAVFDEIPFAAAQPQVAAGLALLQQWTQASRAGQLDFLAVAGDYTRLFVGPGKIIAPPWESAQIDDERLTFQEETLAVRGWYRRFGVLPAQLHAEPDDHIGLELAFMAHLAQLALAAQAAGDTARLAELLAAERGFLRAHPLRWAPKWCGCVSQAARTDYYRGLALVTAGVLAELSTALEPLTPLAVA